MHKEIMSSLKEGNKKQNNEEFQRESRKRYPNRNHSN